MRKAGFLHRDILINNLIMNKDKENPSNRPTYEETSFRRKGEISCVRQGIIVVEIVARRLKSSDFCAKGFGG